MADQIEFTEKEVTLGYVQTHSGSLIIADGIIESEINLNPLSYISVDLNMDNKAIPIVATRQGGRRYLLIPLENAITMEKESGETVTTEDPAMIPETKEEDNAEG